MWSGAALHEGMEAYYASQAVQEGRNDWDDAAAVAEVAASTPEPKGALHAAIPVADLDSDAYARGLAEAPGRWHGPGLHYYGLTEGQEVERDALVAVWRAQHVETGAQVLGPYSDPDGPPPAPPRRPRKAHTRVGHLPDGTAVEQRRSGIVGWDYTASVPAGVSYLHALETDEVRAQIEAAVADAIEATMGDLIPEVGVSRRTSPTKHQVPAPIPAWAQFTHRSNRYGAPQLHVHVIFPHRVQGEDGKFQALDGMAVLSNARSGTAMFQQYLRSGLTQRLGYAWTPVDEHGFADVAGVPDHLKERWAARSQHIRDVADVLREEANLQRAREGRPPMSPTQEARLRNEITRRHRPSKARMREAMETAQAVDRDLPLAEVRAGLSQRGTGQAGALLIAPTVAELVADRAPGSTQREWWEQQAADMGITRGMLRDMVAEAAQDIAPLAAHALDADTIMQEALAAAGREHSTFARRHLVREVARLIPGHLSPQEASEYIQTITDRALGSDDVVQVSWPADATVPESVGDEVAWHVAKSDHVWFTTAAGLETERRVIERAVLGLNTGRGLIDRETLLDAMGEASIDADGNARPLDVGQVAALTQIATSGDAIQTIEAAAGTGKTALLRPYVAAAQAQGYTVLALAPSAQAAQVMGEETGAQAITLDRALVQWENGATAIRIGDESITVNERTIVILDEAGMAGRDKWDALTKVTTDGGAKMLAVGDSSQLSPVRAAGGMFYSVGDEVGRLELTQVHRLTEDWEKKASLGLRAGDAEIVQTYRDHDRIHVADTRDDALAAAFTQYREALWQGKDALMMAATLDDVEALNVLAREHDRQERGRDGWRSSEPVTIGGREWERGDVLLAKRNDGTLRIGAPKRAELTGIEARIGQMSDRLRTVQAKIERAEQRVQKMQRLGITGKPLEIARARAADLRKSRNRTLKRLAKAQTKRADLRAQWDAARSVTNGQRFEVTKVDRDTGSLTVREVIGRENGERVLGDEVVLPRHYVANDARYGHADTVHSKQGATADVGILVADERMTREQAYVGMTRGRQSNVVIESPSRGEEDADASQERLVPGGMLRSILGRSERDVSAVTRLREAADRQESLATLTPRRERVEAAVTERASAVDTVVLEAAEIERRRWAGVIERKSRAGADTTWEQEQYRAVTEKVARLEAAAKTHGDWTTDNPRLAAYNSDLAQREQMRADFLRAEVVRGDPSPELVAAFGERPTEPERLAGWQQAAGTAAIYEDRWREKPGAEADQERSPEQERDLQVVETAKRAWASVREEFNRIRVNRKIGRGMVR